MCRLQSAYGLLPATHCSNWYPLITTGTCFGGRSAAAGHFVSQDPNGCEGGDTNLYRYVKASPTTLTDPSGLQAIISYQHHLYVAFCKISIVAASVWTLLSAAHSASPLADGLSAAVAASATGAIMLCNGIYAGLGLFAAGTDVALNVIFGGIEYYLSQSW